MPLKYTLNALSSAINHGQLDQIQEILQERDAHGVPHVDINAGTPILHKLCFLGMRSSGPRIEQARIREMFEYVLSLRDNYGNPIANPNVMHCNAGNIITAIVDLNDIYLLQLVLDLRTNQGEMVTNIYAGAEPGHFWSPLRRAVYLNKIDMVRALVDARKADGTPLLTLEQIRTDLRGATSNQFDHGAIVTTNNECTNYLTQYIRDRNIQPLTNAVQQRQAPVIQAAAQPIAAGNQFDADQQNTHDPSVTQTAKGSLLALNKTYSNSLDEEQCIREIKAFIGDYDYSTVLNTLATGDKKNGAKEFLNLLTSRFTTIHSYTGYTIKKVLALVWMGVKDNNIAVFPEEIRRTFQPSISVAPPGIINTKKSSFIEKFIEASREYKERGMTVDICAGGSIHKLLEVLNHAHIDVVITTGAQSVNPAAHEMTLAIVGLQLRTRKLCEQNHILSHWDNDDDSTASEFKKSITTSVDQGLQAHFGTLLTEKDRGEIIACLPDMPRPPVPHRELNELVTTITNQVQKTGTPSRQIFVTALHKLAREIYFEELTDEEKHQRLNSEYNAFIQLDVLMEKIDAEQDKSLLEKYNSIKLKNSAFIILSEFIILSKFDPYLKKLDALKEKTTNPIHKNKLVLFHKKIDECAILFKEDLMNNNEDIVELTKQFNDAVQDHINTVKNNLEKEPGIWRNLNPIIKGILGILAVLLVLPAIIVQYASPHRFAGTFFKTPKTEVTEEFEKNKLDVHPKDDFLS